MAAQTVGRAISHVARKDTEAPFCGTLIDNKKDGVYTCAGCGLPLFGSGAKFDSGSGWPSFMHPVAKENVETQRDMGDGSLRVRSKCVRCKGHLGHVFDDGPAPIGLRFCMNSASLDFTDKEHLSSLADPAAEKVADQAGEEQRLEGSRQRRHHARRGAGRRRGWGSNQDKVGTNGR